MEIEKFTDIIGKNLKIIYYNNQDRWVASFERGEIKKGGILVGEYGSGISPDIALSNYATRIRGKTIVFDAYSEHRQEYQVPKDLTHTLYAHE